MKKILRHTILTCSFVCASMLVHHSARGQSLLHDSLTQMLLGFHNRSDTALQKAVTEILPLYPTDSINDQLAEKFLTADSLVACSSQINQQEALAFTEIMVHAFKYMPAQQEASYAIALNNLAVLYNYQGSYEKALACFLQVLDIIKRTLGEGHFEYGNSLNNLALLYMDMGEYDKALPYCQQALSIRKKTLAADNPMYAQNLMDLAKVLWSMGEYEKAAPYCQQALVILKKVLTEKHPYYASCLNGMGLLYEANGEYEKALVPLHQAVQIWKGLAVEKHTDYATGLHNLARLYYRLGRYDTSMFLYNQVLAIRKKELGDDSPDYITTLFNLADVYAKTGRSDSALLLYKQSLDARKKILGEEHPDYVNALKNLGLQYNLSDNNEAALPLLIRAVRSKISQLRRTYSVLSEQEKIILLNRECYQFNYLPSLLLTYKKSAKMLQQVYANELALKGMVLEDQQLVMNSIRNSGDSAVQALYTQWRSNKSFIGKQFLLPISMREPSLDSTEQATNLQEQQLSRRSAAFGNYKRSEAITLNDISRKLLKGQVAIEFMQFQFYSKRCTDSIYYAALVLLPGDTVCKFVPLCEERSLRHFVTRVAAVRTTGKPNDSLYNLVWKPLEKYLAGVSTIYYAPAGLLHQISFQSLRADTRHLLIDKYQLNQVFSTRSIVLPPTISSRPASEKLWGNINYGFQTYGMLASRGEEAAYEEAATSSFNFYNADSRGSRVNGWPALPGTKQEIDNIGSMLSKAGTRVTADSGMLATEEAFKAMDGKSPQVLHLATHGFFIPVTDKKPASGAGKDAFTMQQNPMFRSGLILAGGNHAWKGEPIQPGAEDGILTAYEIAQMDLSNTDLVVLSACETALGDLQGSEGVFGLQRAFKMAGVKQLIISLWKVPDAETTELMTLFYRNWLGGQSTREALRHAQLKMKATYPPEKWAAFVLVE